MAAIARVGALLSLTLLAACPDRLPLREGCTFDAECASGERCVDSVCVGGSPVDSGPTPDAGPQPDSGPPPDGGPPPPTDAGPDGDAGPQCTPDDLDNETLATAYIQTPDIDDGRLLEGSFCVDEREYFGFYGFADDVLQAVVSYGRDADVDLRLYPPSDQVSGTGIGTSFNDRMEVATTRFAESGTHQLELRLYGGEADTGLDYDLQIRSGLPCQLDSVCGLADERCLMPLWTPTASTGSQPDDETIFMSGLCGIPYSPPASCIEADSVAAEGISNSRTDALTNFPTGVAWSCQHDEDWYRYTTPGGAPVDLTIGFAQNSAGQGSWLLAAFSDAGDMLAAAGYDQLPSLETRTLLIPMLAANTTIYIRVFQLHADDFGEYSISASTLTQTCNVGTDCTSNARAADYGRVQCDTVNLGGACVCPDDPINVGEVACSPS
jgi:hypothetical protein